MSDLKQQGTRNQPAPAHGGRRRQAARRFGIPKEEILDFSASINLLGPPAGIASALRAAITEVAHYPDEYAGALARDMAQSIGVGADEVVPGNGSIEVIYWLARVLAPARVLTVEPTFSEYRRACEGAGADCVAVQMPEERDFAVDTGRVHPQGYDAVFLCNPNNPTGQLVEPGEVAALWRRCEVAGAHLIVDEAFIDFCGRQKSVISQFGVMPEGLHVVRSLTKSYALAGLRLGCLVTSTGFAARIRQQMPPWNINSHASIAGRVALADRDFLAATRDETAAARARLLSDLGSIGGIDPLPSAANFLLCRLVDASSVEVAERLAHGGILVRDCRSFGLGDRYLRIAVRSERENYQLVSALRRVLAEA